MDAELFTVGLEARTRVLGEEYVARAMSSTDSFNQEFQQIVTEYVTMTYGGGPATPSLKPAQKSIPVKAIA